MDKHIDTALQPPLGVLWGLVVAYCGGSRKVKHPDVWVLKDIRG